MELTGRRRLPVDRATAWRALNDPARLQAAIPGCEALERTGQDEYAVILATALGPVRARFRGKLRLEDVVEPSRYRLRFEGQGGAAGFANGTADVTLGEEGSATLLDYSVKAQVGGRIAQVGSRLIDSAALKLADDFFAAFERQLAPPGEAPAPTTRAPRAALRYAAIAAAVALLLLLAYLLLR